MSPDTERLFIRAAIPLSTRARRSGSLSHLRCGAPRTSVSRLSGSLSNAFMIFFTARQPYRISRPVLRCGRGFGKRLRCIPNSSCSLCMLVRVSMVIGGPPAKPGSILTSPKPPQRMSSRHVGLYGSPSPPDSVFRHSASPLPPNWNSIRPILPGNLYLCRLRSHAFFGFSSADSFSISGSHQARKLAILRDSLTAQGNEHGFLPSHGGIASGTRSRDPVSPPIQLTQPIRQSAHHSQPSL
jgi:hypothetical protein